MTTAIVHHHGFLIVDGLLSREVDVLEPTRLAVLDHRLVLRMNPWPQLGLELFARGIRRAHRPRARRPYSPLRERCRGDR